MRIMRNQEQWQSIIEAQQSSGLTIIDYCRQHKLSLTSFYAHRKKLNLTQSGFIRAKVTQQVEFETRQPDNINLSVGNATLTFPSSIPASYLAQLLRECAQ
ncbi:hypothetical protein [Pseudoalteromonas sp. '520P1 No. 423']|uniref:IS66 family insertion sequence element accessory protein TnpA n=2 Tax=unclassified Pseudoalteromonas TaxID=194690 RepID=UPI0007513886|nr:hypothetical protein [Pseudoalteromonas sp. '520P1 No. 423']